MKSPSENCERAENSKTENFLHTFPHSLFTFSCESFGLSCVCLVRQKENFPRGGKFTVLLQLQIFFLAFYFVFLCFGQKFSRAVNKSRKKKTIVEIVERNAIKWAAVFRSFPREIPSLQFKTRKIYIIIFFFRRKKKKIQKIPTFCAREKGNEKMNFFCCKWAKREGKRWENFCDFFV